jgi:tRNA U55 pseudouridine synthase TruB
MQSEGVQEVVGPDQPVPRCCFDFRVHDCVSLAEVQCMHETQQQLRKLVHEIGLELKTTAVCTQVRRTRDGFFTLDDALLRTQWNLNSIQDAIGAAAPRVAAELENLRPRLDTQEHPSPGQPWDSKGPRSTLGLESCAGH